MDEIKKIKENVLAIRINNFIAFYIDLVFCRMLLLHNDTNKSNWRFEKIS